MILSLTQALPLQDYDLSLLTKAELEHIKNGKIPLLQRCRAQSCFELRKMASANSSEFKSVDAAVLRNQKGQPYFANMDYNISISHKDDYCWLGLVNKPGIIGVDIEKLVQPESTAVMFKHVANDFEHQHFRNLGDHYSKEMYLTILWSLKESLYKCENAKHEDLSFLIDPFQETAQLNFNPGSQLEKRWSDQQIKIKYKIQNSYVCSSIHVF